MSERRIQDRRTRIVHSSSLSKSGHYEYDEFTDCDINTSTRAHEWGSRGRDEVVTCFKCIAANTKA